MITWLNNLHFWSTEVGPLLVHLKLGLKCIFTHDHHFTYYYTFGPTSNCLNVHFRSTFEGKLDQKFTFEQLGGGPKVQFDDVDQNCNEYAITCKITFKYIDRSKNYTPHILLSISEVWHWEGLCHETMTDILFLIRSISTV